MKRTQNQTFQALFLLLLLHATVTAQDTLWKTYIDAGTTAFNEKRFTEAERRFKLARKEAEHFGQHDPRLALSCLKLALVYLRQDNSIEAQKLEARELSQQALTIWEKNSGTEPLETANNLEDLAGAYLNKREYAFVEKLLLRSLAIRRSVLNPGNPTIAFTLRYLAITNYFQKNYAAASPQFEQALVILEKAHMSYREEAIIAVLRNYALTRRADGKYAEAESLLNRALKLREEGRGPEHLGMIEILDELADLYAEQKKHPEAEAARKRRLEITEKIYGLNDVRVADAINYLATAYVSRYEYALAEALYKEKLSKLEDVRGNTQNIKLKMLDGLVILYWQEKAYDAAYLVLQQCLEIVKATVGAEHALYADYLNLQGTFLMEQERYTDAEPILKRALEVRERGSEQEHPSTAQSLNNLAKDYYYQGKYAEAEPLYQKAISITQKLKNESPAGLAWYMKNYALLLYAQGRKAEAEPLFRESLEVLNKSPNNNNAAVSLYELGELYRKQKRYDEAEPLYKDAIARMEKTAASDQFALAKALERYATLLRQTNRETEAAQLETRAAEIKSKYARKS